MQIRSEVSPRHKLLHVCVTIFLIAQIQCNVTGIQNHGHRQLFFVRHTSAFPVLLTFQQLLLEQKQRSRVNIIILYNYQAVWCCIFTPLSLKKIDYALPYCHDGGFTTADASWLPWARALRRRHRSEIVQTESCCDL